MGFFDHDTIDVILSFPLDQDTSEDIVLGGYNRNGCYSVKSGY